VLQVHPSSCSGGKGSSPYAISPAPFPEAPPQALSGRARVRSLRGQGAWPTFLAQQARPRSGRPAPAPEGPPPGRVLVGVAVCGVGLRETLSDILRTVALALHPARPCQVFELDSISLALSERL
jgi:hypothetical protein